MSEKKFNPNDHMIDLRGRSYLPVAARVAWFRDCHPGGCVDTDILMVGDMYLARARVIVDGAIVATGHATLRDGKGQTWAGREIEKAETAAIGRALAVAGYGTLAAADELDDTDYLSDAPVDRAARIDAAKKNLGPAPRQRPNAAPPPGYSAPEPPAPAPVEPPAPPAADNDLPTANDIINYVEVRANAQGKPYIVAEGGLTTFTREPFRAAGVDCDDWTTPGEKHMLDKPLLVRYVQKGDYKSIVEVEAET